MAATYFVLSPKPPDLPEDPAVRLMYFGWVVELGLKRKDQELARGLNARGEPLPAVRPETAKRRRSVMTPSGEGDRRAPYLMPGRGLSRTRSLLAGKAHVNYAEFWWRYDAYTGDQWGKILAAHARRGKAYDVVGLSPKGRAWVAAQALSRWRKWKAGTLATPTTYTPAVAAEIRIPLVGRTNLEHATEGVGGTLEQARKAIAEGRSSGFLSAPEWERYWRQARPSIAPARPGTSRSVQRGASNVLLQHVWTPPPTRPPVAAAPSMPTPPPAPKKAAMPAAPMRIGPASERVAVDPAAPKDVRDAVAAALRAIDAVHRVGGAAFPASIKVDSDMGGRDESILGVYRGATDRGIGVRPGYLNAAHTFLHEFAHLLDSHRFGVQGPGEEPSAAISEWWKAASSTGRILDLRANAALSEDEDEAEYLGYLLRPREVWARAYAQWVATEGGDPDVAEAFRLSIESEPDYNSEWWDDEDFEAVAAAFRALFRRIRWID